MALAVDRYELGPVGTNCYVVRRDPDAVEAVVIDPGDAAAKVEQALERVGAACVAILVTHTHFDHIGAVAELAESTGAPVYAPAGELPVLERPDDFYGSLGISIRPWTPEQLLEGGEQLALAGMDFEVVAVPGHSPAHLAFYTAGCLFSGDVLFAGSVGRTDLPGSSWAVLVESIRTLVERYPPETVVYSGHGAETTLGAEVAGNPFLTELRAS